MNNEPPLWAKSLVWSNPRTLHALRASRDVIPSQNGIYVFSKIPFANSPGGILYVGKATTLKTRLASCFGGSFGNTGVFQKWRQNFKLAEACWQGANPDGIYARWSQFVGQLDLLQLPPTNRGGLDRVAQACL